MNILMRILGTVKVRRRLRREEILGIRRGGELERLLGGGSGGIELNFVFEKFHKFVIGLAEFFL